MSWYGAAAAVALIVVVLVDAFEAIILPRRVRHSYRIARLFYRSTWAVWRALARLLPKNRWRAGFLSVFGPLSLLALLAVWAAGLIVGFGLLHLALDAPLSGPNGPNDTLGAYLYFSGTTFFTLGYGDIVPTGARGRILAVAEAGLGFGFLALVISYLPTVYQAFSARERTISLLDARAGSPPSAGELFRRLADARDLASLGPLLADWERWAALVLETHLSFPLLSYYRSQHDNQSWVGALMTILDTSALLIGRVDGPDGRQARLTFAMARHAAVDLGLLFRLPPRPPDVDRLPAADLARLREWLRDAGIRVHEGPAAEKSLTELRALYEPFVNVLALYFEFELPPIVPSKPVVDNWQTSAWRQRSPGLGNLPAPSAEDEHFD
jgi:hypothetical protein